MNVELLRLFPTPLLVVPYGQSVEKELSYLKSVNFLEQKGNGNFRSEDTFLLKNNELCNIKVFIELAIHRFVKDVLNSDQTVRITQSWANRNPKGSVHHEHVHPNSILSGVMYFQINEKLPPIHFVRERQDSLKLNVIKYNQINAEVFKVLCKPGDLILFPSSLRHGVPINEGEEDRVSLSFNTFCDGAIGSKELLTLSNTNDVSHEKI